MSVDFRTVTLSAVKVLLVLIILATNVQNSNTSSQYNFLISYVYLVVENINDTVSQLQPVDIKV